MHRTERRMARRLAASAIGLAVALSFVSCPPPVTTLVAPTAPVAVLTLLNESSEIQFGNPVELSGADSHLGENTEGLELELRFFWSIDSAPTESLLIDDAIVPLGTPSGDDDDDDSANPGDDDDAADDDDDDDAPADAQVQFMPDVQGLYGITLQVSDGTRVSDVAHVLVSIGGGNSCPVADAGADIVAQTGVPVTLDGTASSDADITGEEDDEQVLSFTWHFSLVPSDSAAQDGDIFYQGTPHPVFIPDVPGTYILQLRTDDGLCTALPDYITVQASNGNQAPVADAGNSQVLTPCAPTQVGMDASASYDPEGQPLDFEWHFTSVPNGSDVSDAFLNGQYSSSPSFNWDVPGIYTLELRVSDGTLESEPDYVAVQAVPSLPNGAPISNAGDDLLVEATAACTPNPYGGGSCNPCGTRNVVVSGTGSYDPDNDPLNYQWDLQSGDAAILGVESNELEVELPSLEVSYGSQSTNVVTLSLTVFDCRAADDDTVTVTFLCDGSN